MSIKHSKDISLSKIPYIYGAVCAIAMVLRTVQVMLFIDPETGFATGGSVLFTALYILLGATVVCLFIACFLSNETSDAELSGMKSVLLSNAAFALDLCFILKFDKNVFASGTAVFDVFGGSTIEIFRSLMLTETLPNFLGGVFALPSAGYMFIASGSFRKGNSKIAKHRILALSPLCWVACKFINRFVKQISFIEVSDLLLELIMLAFCLAFFYAFAQVAGGVYSEDARWRLVALGFLSSLMCFVVGVPRLIGLIFDKLNSEYPLYTVAFVFGSFALITALELLRNPVKKEKYIAEANIKEQKNNEEV